MSCMVWQTNAGEVTHYEYNTDLLLSLANTWLYSEYRAVPPEGPNNGARRNHPLLGKHCSINTCLWQWM
jgi:hypothetical protein